jgi:hypothetical protein
MRKVWRDVLIFSAFAVSIPLVLLLLIRLTPKPPDGEMEHAREVLSLAEKSRANTYSKKLYTEARVFYDSAMVNWRKENKKFIFFRDYEKVKMFAELSTKKATQAAESSTSSVSSLKEKLKPKIDNLNSLVAQIDKLFTTYPLSSEIRNRISTGKILLKEAQIVYKKGQYLEANRKITDSEYLLTESFNNASENLKNYFKSYPVWKKWVDRTLYESRKNHDYSIIIDKFSRKCIIYHSGAKKYEFEAELGKNWVGDKRVKGDHATPEGMYRSTKRIDRGRTKYYKALLIDYPNNEDKAKFKSEVERGTLPASAKIGGLIEIHGNGGKGIDWTEGCIALTDREMDIIFKFTKVGTPVTIVGSMTDLKEVLDK